MILPIALTMGKMPCHCLPNRGRKRQSVVMAQNILTPVRQQGSAIADGLDQDIT
ncbi:hypothetical protein [Nostoc sp.]|uniref:hypothetical protein n=1 Tax=Nostoc sp. TaxID=1180 RepID=UPI002FF8730A